MSRFGTRCSIEGVDAHHPASGDPHVPDSLHSPPSAAALPLTSCKSASGGAAAAPQRDLVTPAGLTTTVTRKLGISEVQANAAIGSMLGTAQQQLSPEDFTKLTSAIPGADNYFVGSNGRRRRSRSRGGSSG